MKKLILLLPFLAVGCAHSSHVPTQDEKGNPCKTMDEKSGFTICDLGALIWVPNGTILDKRALQSQSQPKPQATPTPEAKKQESVKKK